MPTTTIPCRAMQRIAVIYLNVNNNSNNNTNLTVNIMVPWNGMAFPVPVQTGFQYNSPLSIQSSMREPHLSHSRVPRYKIVDFRQKIAILEHVCDRLFPSEPSDCIIH